LIYTFGPFTLDVDGRTLHRDGVAIPLTGKVFDTLVLLITHRDRMLAKEELVHAIWPNQSPSDDNLTQNICHIRRALGDEAGRPQYVRTFARRGYRFIALATEGSDRVEPGGLDLSNTLPATGSKAPIHPGRWRIASITAAAIVLGVVVVRLMIASGMSTATDARHPRLQFREPLPVGHSLAGGAALSPDGRYLAYTAVDRSGVSKLWVRLLQDSDSARVLEHTDGAQGPFWSPDSRFIGYYDNQQILRIAVEGGTPRPVASVQRGGFASAGVSWGAADQILYADRGQILSVPASGGNPVVAADPGQVGGGELRWPHFLPDGRHFLFVIDSADANRAGAYVGTLGSTATIKVADRVAGPMTYSAGHLVFLRDRTVFAQAFDASRTAMTSAPRTVAADVEPGAELSATSNGVLAITQHKHGARGMWLDRSGRQLGDSFQVQKALRNLELGPDGKSALGMSDDGGTLAIWKLEGRAESVVLKNNDIKMIDEWSPDGELLLVYARAKGHDGLWTVPARGPQREPVPIKLQGHAVAGRLSPDGHLIAYVSDEADRPEVYLTTFPDSGARQRVSAAGGSQPQWRGDGKELFFVSADRHVMATPVVGGVARTATALFALPHGVFASTRDGQRFLAVIPEQPAGDDSVTILMNERAPTGPDDF
jgi:DNA-binding winged helix-turn-helix (wHTH) protein